MCEYLPSVLLYRTERMIELRNLQAELREFRHENGTRHCYRNPNARLSVRTFLDPKNTHVSEDFVQPSFLIGNEQLDGSSLRELTR